MHSFERSRQTSVALHVHFAYLSIDVRLMAFNAAVVVAVLCTTGVGMYGACDGLVATGRWQHGCRTAGPLPPVMHCGMHVEPPCAPCKNCTCTVAQTLQYFTRAVGALRAGSR